MEATCSTKEEVKNFDLKTRRKATAQEGDYDIITVPLADGPRLSLPNVIGHLR
jgi:hypothetical protein